MHLAATCCALGLLAASDSPSPHGGWEPLGDAPRAAIEIDRRRIVRDGEVVGVWVRAVADRESSASEFEAAGARTEDVARVRDTLDHSIHHWSFRCNDGTHALSSSSYYATDGTLIRSFDVARPVYWPVQADTVGQKLLAVACGPTRVAEESDPKRDDPAEDDSASAPR